MALATANIQDNNALKIMDNLPHSTLLSPLTPHSTPGVNNLSSSTTNHPHLIRYMKSEAPGPTMTSPIAGAIIGGTTTATVGGQQLRLVHLDQLEQASLRLQYYQPCLPSEFLRHC